MLLGAMKGKLFCICEAINMWLWRVVTSTRCQWQKWTIFKTANSNKEVALHYTATFVPPEFCSKEQLNK
jgi:hypothetical protein